MPTRATVAAAAMAADRTLIRRGGCGCCWSGVCMVLLSRERLSGRVGGWRRTGMADADEHRPATCTRVDAAGSESALSLKLPRPALVPSSAAYGKESVFLTTR